MCLNHVTHASQTLINQSVPFLSVFLCLKATKKMYNRMEVTSRRHFKNKDTLFEECQTWHASQTFTEQNMANNMKKSINLFFFFPSMPLYELKNPEDSLSSMRLTTDCVIVLISGRFFCNWALGLTCTVNERLDAKVIYYRNTFQNQRNSVVQCSISRWNDAQKKCLCSTHNHIKCQGIAK